MIAAELYGSACPVVLAGQADWPRITAAPRITIDAGPSGASIALA